MKRMLIPNCSEFTIRIKHDDISRNGLKKLEGLISRLNDGTYTKEEYKELFDEEPYDEPCGIEIWSEHGSIFGVKHTKIKGDTGDHGEFLINWLDKRKIKYECEED